MKAISTILISLIFSVSVYAEPVASGIARQAARKFYISSVPQKNILTLSISDVKPAMTYTPADFGWLADECQDLSLFYVFNIGDDRGFVIISADDMALPVIGYSETGAYKGENLPPALAGMLERRAEELIELIRDNKEQHPAVKAAWAVLLDACPPKGFKPQKSAGPLLSTQWNQSPWYNDLCPFDYYYNQRTVTGCPATAMAQIMKYYEYPANGTGYHSYSSGSYGTLSANFEAENYNWSGMPDAINYSNEAIATLMYHCGVSVEMMYGVAETGGSAGYMIEAQSPVQHCCEYAYKTYFGYKPTLEGLLRENFNDATWIQKLKDEIDAGRPIQYAGFGQGGGHTWVCDGYDVNNYFHMNWGWGGIYDGYFLLNQLNPGSGGAGGGSGTFNFGQQALIGIEPAGGSGGSSQFDLRAYSAIYIEPNPISFTGPFAVGVQIGNFDSQNFSGSLAAWLFNSAGDFVSVVQELGGINLQSQYYNTYYFETQGLLATPGQYNIGIYYKAGSGDWSIIGNGSYSNYATVNIVGPNNTMQMFAALNLNPAQITSGQPFQVTADVANTASAGFQGTVSADLYDSEGNYLGELASTTLNLQPGYHVPITFNCPGVQLEPGSYILAIWDKPDGGDWILVGSTTYANPITVQIALPQQTADQYENNDEIALAYPIPLNFSGNMAIVITTGSTIHTGNDVDYYRLDLPAGSQYRITGRAHDSYNSGNGQTYTDDVIWVIGDGTNWSPVYDDIMDGEVIADGGITLFLGVSNYYQGQTGTYLLDLTVERGTFGTAENSFTADFSIYPNPAASYLVLSTDDLQIQKGSTTVEIVDLYGRIVERAEKLNFTNGEIRIDVHRIPEGQYLIRIRSGELVLSRKLLISGSVQ